MQVHRDHQQNGGSQGLGQRRTGTDCSVRWGVLLGWWAVEKPERASGGTASQTQEMPLNCRFKMVSCMLFGFHLHRNKRLWFHLLFLVLCAWVLWWSQLPCGELPYEKSHVAGTEGGLWTIASEELRPSAQQPTKNFILPTARGGRLEVGPLPWELWDDQGWPWK